MPAALPGKRVRPQLRIEGVAHVVLGDRRRAHDLPIFLGQHVAGEIILVQPVHDQDDRTRPGVVQSAVEGVVEPVACRLPLGL
jgi:hypothetical protein